jgi:outer membrane biosynthesis protein TonB
MTGARLPYAFAVLLLAIVLAVPAAVMAAEGNGGAFLHARVADRVTAVQERLATAAVALRADPDHDGLTTGFERARSHTRPHRADSDGDGLRDGFELHRSRTNPNRADSDGDGYSDRAELIAGSNPRSGASVPGKPAATATPAPPQTGSSPAANGPASSPAASAPATRGGIPATSPTPPKSTTPPAEEPPAKKPPSKEPPAEEPPVEEPPAEEPPAEEPPVEEPPVEEPPVEEPPTEEPPIEEPPAEEPPVPPTEASACAAGAQQVTTASALTTAVRNKQSSCVTAALGNVTLSSLGDRTGVVVSTSGGGSIGLLKIEATQGLTVRGARLRAVEIRHSDRTVVESSTIGGTQANRVEDQLIFMPDRSDNVVIRNNDIGWTVADDSGNTGYGCRCYGETNGLQFVGNIVHDIAADGFQGTNGANVLIDRNKIGPVGANPDSSEHSDNIQIVSNGPGLRITNNWIYRQGWYEGRTTNNSGSLYVHGGTSNSVVIENNFFQEAQGRTEICGLGTGGTSRSNITIRHNTWLEGGLTFTGFPGFEWDCDSGSGNTVAGNISIDPDGGFAQDGSAGAAAFSANIWGRPGTVAFDASGNCTSAACNPAGGEAIGYRKPSGVPW